MRLGRREVEWVLPLLILFLLGMGATVLFSATHSQDFSVFNRQLLYIGISLMLFTGAAFLPDRVVFAFAYVAYIGSLLLLLLVLFVGTGPTGRWLGLGAFHIQPSELAKLTTVLALARFLSDRRNDLSQLKNILYLAVIAALPFLLIAIEPDLGTSLVIPVIAGAMAFWGGIPLIAMVLILSPVAVMVASINPYSLVAVIGMLILFAYVSGIRLPLGLIWGTVVGVIGAFTPTLLGHLQPYQRQRLTAFLNPEADPLGSGYQLIQSKVAIGSGRFWGKGYLEGSQTQGGFLPEQQTDFIFSVVGEELGFFGAVVALFLFWLLIVRLLMLAKKVANPFSSLVTVGVGSILAFQVIVNVGMTTGIMPVTGLPLPLFSYGGSSMMTTMIGLGLVTGMGSRWRQHG
ncbi:rod shape-determining protein RodA [bacterium]|nr:rod shape-determining protein RodA [bacterium]